VVSDLKYCWTPVMNGVLQRVVLGPLGLYSLEKKRSGEILSMCIDTSQGGVKKKEPDTSHWCPVTGKEATDTNCYPGNSI